MNFAKLKILSTHAVKMSPEQWEHLNSLFQEALELAPDDRPAFMDRVCDGDDELRSELESLLASDQHGWNLLEIDAVELLAPLLAQDPAQVRPGQEILHYRIISLIGRGGMGEVYCAADSRLGRKVAIKFLPQAFSTDADRLRRFEQEARAASTLNHPNITVVYDVGAHQGSPYIVTEFLEGETLRERMRSNNLTTRKAIDYALQIAAGLAAAHDKGIVHRDLKPENIFITREGRAKILDFGLAKLVQPQFGKELQLSEAIPDFDPGSVHTSSSPTLPQSPLSNSDTAPGVVMGTASYMSPEQVRGVAIDHRSDLFSFGSIFYEMLSGNLAFWRESPVETMNAILKEEPPELSVINPSVSPALDRVVCRCLEKNPAERFFSANDLAFALEVVSGSGTAPAVEVSGSTKLGTLTLKGKVLERTIWAVLVAALALALGLFYFWRPRPEINPARFSVSLPEKTSRITSLSVSPNGRQVAFVATTDGKVLIWLRAIDSLAAHALTGTDGALNLFWSRDSKFIGFFAEGKLKKIEAAGGPVEVLCDAPEGRGGSWNATDTIVFAPQPFTPLQSVSASGGAVTQITSFDPAKGENSHRWPAFLPDGRHLIFFVRNEKAEQSGIWLGSIDSRERTFLFPSESAAVYAPGYLLFLRQQRLMAQKFDEARLRISGEPFPVADEVGYARNLNERQGYFSVSENGVLVYSAGMKDSRRYAWFDRSGKETGTIAIEGDIRDMVLAPNDKRVAVQFVDNKSSVANEDIWLIDLERNLASRFTFTPVVDDFPVWSPNGERLVFNSARNGPADLYECDYNRAGKEALLLQSDTNKNPTDWSLDGRYILYENMNANRKSDIWVLPLFGDKKPFPFLVTDFNESQGHWSPDGRWIGYVSDESGRDEIYIQNFPDGGQKLLVSNGGGRQPIWRRDGKELYYFAPNGNLMAVEIRPGGKIEAGVPRSLFETRVDNFAASNRYAVSADGKRFLINSPSEEALPRPITVVLDWNNELKQ
ncbi:MAG TPA: protein kinase [Pyrinomonadaceae bacterium]|nr:protein kinase [Pyrinomonadaceae bacterium]